MSINYKSVLFYNIIKEEDTLTKEQIAHDLALVVVENMLEDIDDRLGAKEYSKEAVELYLRVKELIKKELD